MNEVEQTLNKGVTLITGASAGLGQALVCKLVEKGHKVVGFGRSESGLAKTALQAQPLARTQAQPLAGDQFVPMAVDVSDPAAVRAAFADIAAQHGPVTRLINNAAVYPRADFLAQTPEEFDQVMAINLGGLVSCCHTALQSMIQSGTGRIVNVASFADIAPLPASSAYSVSKGAARILTRALVADLGDRFPDIVINDWLPGMLATRMGIPDGLTPDVAAQWGANLLCWHDPALNGAVFEMDSEVLPPRSLKRRLRDKVMGSAPVARRL